MWTKEALVNLDIISRSRSKDHQYFRVISREIKEKFNFPWFLGLMQSKIEEISNFLKIPFFIDFLCFSLIFLVSRCTKLEKQSHGKPSSETLKEVFIQVHLILVIGWDLKLHPKQPVHQMKRPLYFKLDFHRKFHKSTLTCS